jgi:hypothetical protein
VISKLRHVSGTLLWSLYTAPSETSAITEHYQTAATDNERLPPATLVSVNRISNIYLQRRMKEKIETHDNFLALYLDDSFKDFTMSYGEATFKAHKCVLAASSMYFQRMFSNDWKESTLCTMAPLSDLESVVFSTFLQFIYTRNYSLL